MKRTLAHIHLGLDAPEVRVLTSDYFGTMLSLELGDVTVHIDGYNAVAAVNARALAKVLVAAADQVDAAVEAAQASAVDQRQHLSER